MVVGGMHGGGGVHVGDVHGGAVHGRGMCMVGAVH